MDAKTIEWIIFGPLIVGMLIAGWWAAEESHRRLDDPNDDRTLFLDQLPGKLALHPQGLYRVTIFRQSGNVHAEDLIVGTAQEALARALATFRRAKIEAVHVASNSDTELLIGRLYHDHRGSNEGKKVGRAQIQLIERRDPPDREPKQAAAILRITIEPIGVTCDCGQRIDVPYEEIEEARACEACGADITPDPYQLARLEAVAEEARAEALERYRNGETDILVSRNTRIAREDST